MTNPVNKSEVFISINKELATLESTLSQVIPTNVEEGTVSPELVEQKLQEIYSIHAQIESHEVQLAKLEAPSKFDVIEKTKRSNLQKKIDQVKLSLLEKASSFISAVGEKVGSAASNIIRSASSFRESLRDTVHNDERSSLKSKIHEVANHSILIERLKGSLHFLKSSIAEKPSLAKRIITPLETTFESLQNALTPLKEEFKALSIISDTDTKYGLGGLLGSTQKALEQVDSLVANTPYDLSSPDGSKLSQTEVSLGLAKAAIKDIRHALEGLKNSEIEPMASAYFFSRLNHIERAIAEATSKLGPVELRYNKLRKALEVMESFSSLKGISNLEISSSEFLSLTEFYPLFSTKLMGAFGTSDFHSLFQLAQTDEPSKEALKRLALLVDSPTLRFRPKMPVVISESIQRKFPIVLFAYLISTPIATLEARTQTDYLIELLKKAITNNKLSQEAQRGYYEVLTSLETVLAPKSTYVSGDDLKTIRELKHELRYIESSSMPNMIEDKQEEVLTPPLTPHAEIKTEKLSEKVSPQVSVEIPQLVKTRQSKLARLKSAIASFFNGILRLFKSLFNNSKVTPINE